MPPWKWKSRDCAPWPPLRGAAPVLELGRQPDRPAPLGLRLFAVDPCEEEPEIIPPAEHVLRGALARHGGLEVGTAARDEVLREIAGALHPDAVAVKAPVVVPGGRLREPGLHFAPPGQEPLDLFRSGPRSQAAKFPGQPPEPLIFLPPRGSVSPAGGDRRFPADLERGRRVVGEKSKPPDPGEKRAIHFALAIRGEAAHDFERPALDLPPPERAGRRRRPP